MTKLATVPRDMESGNPAVEKRARLLAMADGIGPILAEEARQADIDRRLTPTAMRALRQSGLLGLKMPVELGGFEADNALQFEVFERVAYYSTAAAWCLFIYADVIGMVAANLPDERVAELLAGDNLPVICGGGGLIPGKLVPAEGGYRLSGKWVYGSGSAGADYFVVTAVDNSDPDAPVARFCLVPAKDIKVEDNWNVVGLRGTGSSDFQADDVFVPMDMTYLMSARPLRGGGIFHLGVIGYVVHTVPAVAIGGTFRALEELTRLAETKARGYSTKTPLAHRPVFQAFLARARLNLSAMRAMMLEIGERIVVEADKLNANPLEVEIELRAASSLATQTAVGVMSEIVRYCGGEGARAGHLVERTMRDVQMAQTHYFISDTSFELHGRGLLGEKNLNALS